MFFLFKPIKNTKESLSDRAKDYYEIKKCDYLIRVFIMAGRKYSLHKLKTSTTKVF